MNAITIVIAVVWSLVTFALIVDAAQKGPNASWGGVFGISLATAVMFAAVAFVLRGVVGAFTGGINRLSLLDVLRVFGMLFVPMLILSFITSVTTPAGDFPKTWYGVIGYAVIFTVLLMMLGYGIRWLVKVVFHI
jgi:hypothetical protein